MTITLAEFLAAVSLISSLYPKYRLGDSGDNGYCDCIGLIIGALERAGIDWRGIHGSNYAARYALKSKIRKITSAKDLKVGDLVFKGRTDTSKLPNRYKKDGSLYNGDLHDYYHVGVVTSVDPLEITHMTSPTIKHDTSLGKWGFVGECKYVDMTSQIPTTIPTKEKTAVVVATSGKTVNMRRGAGRNYKLVERIPLGSVVQLLGDDNPDWDKIRWGNKTGWMMDCYLAEGEEVA